MGRGSDGVIREMRCPVSGSRGVKGRLRLAGVNLYLIMNLMKYVYNNKINKKY